MQKDEAAKEGCTTSRHLRFSMSEGIGEQGFDGRKRKDEVTSEKRRQNERRKKNDVVLWPVERGRRGKKGGGEEERGKRGRRGRRGGRGWRVV